MIELPGTSGKQTQIIPGGAYLNPSFREFLIIDCQQIRANNSNRKNIPSHYKQESAETTDSDPQK